MTSVAAAQSAEVSAENRILGSARLRTVVSCPPMCVMRRRGVEMLRA